MRIAANDDTCGGPGLADPGDYPAQYGKHVSGLRAASGPQHGGNQSPGTPLTDMQRHVAVTVVMGVKQGELLIAIRGAVGIVGLENDHRRGGVIAGGKHIDQSLVHSVGIGGRNRVFQSAHGRLEGQVGILIRQATGAHFQDGITPQTVTIIGVGIAAADLIDTLSQ